MMIADIDESLGHDVASYSLSFINGFENLTVDDIHVQLMGYSQTALQSYAKDYDAITGTLKLSTSGYGLSGDHSMPVIIVIKPSLIFWPTPASNDGTVVTFDLSAFDLKDAIDPYRLGVWTSTFNCNESSYRPIITYNNYVLTLTLLGKGGYANVSGFEIFSLY